MDACEILYRTLKRLIELGRTEGLTEKIDIFYAADKLAPEHYTELVEMLTPKEQGATD